MADKSRNDLLKELDSVSETLHKQFTGDGAADRLTQFDSHLETCKMVVSHLFDEADRMKGYK